MNFISTIEASKKWGISPTRITILAKNGRIPGATQISSRWMIPENAEKPTDKRKKGNSNNIDLFRYPTFEGVDCDKFNPPLSRDELLLKRVIETGHTCNFDEAEKMLSSYLCDTIKNKYLRIFALYEKCVLSMLTVNKSKFYESYAKLNAELKSDFPYKKEMSTIIHEIDALLGNSGFFIDEFRFDYEYPYHESYKSHLASLKMIKLIYCEPSLLNLEMIAPYEMLCSYFDDKDCYLDSQTMHFYLSIAYGKLLKVDEMKYHCKIALMIAKKYKLYFQPAMLYYYYGKIIESVLPEFPENFANTIRNFSNDIHERFTKFMNSISNNNIYNMLSSRDFAYVLFAVQGYSYKEISGFLHISLTNVANRYSTIFKILGVNSKYELIAYYNKAIRNDVEK